MRFRKSVGLLAFALILSGCATLEDLLSQPNTTSQVSEGSASESVTEPEVTSEDVTSIFDSIISGTEETSIISTTSEPGSEDIAPANIATFATDIVSDPLITYTAGDYTVKPFPNGFTYPLDAQVQPTNAYLEFWHPETDLALKIVASKQIFQWIEQYGVHEQNLADLYWPVTLEVVMNQKRFVYYEVGMRMKGNTSRQDFIDNDGDIYNSLNFKLSFNELWDTDEYIPYNLKKTWTKAANPEWKVRDDRTFMGDESGKLGLKKIDIKWNKSRDDSLVIQPFIFSFFQKHGLISQNSTLTTLNVNGTRLGVVTINEPVDKHLLRRYFPKAAAAGELYKVGWGKPSPSEQDVKGSLRYEDLRWNDDQLIADAVIGEEDKFRGYAPAYDAKEYDDTAANPFAKLINLMKVLKDNEGKSVGEFAPALEAVIDINSFLKYAAVSYLMGNIDDMRNWGNNYYIFFNPSQNNKAYFIPYDYDWGLGLTWEAGNTRMFGASPFETRYLMNTSDWQENRLFWYTILTSNNHERPYHNITMNQAYRDQYVSYILSLNNDSFYTNTTFNNLFNTYKATYNTKSGSDLDRPADKDNPAYYVSPFNNTTFMTNFINSMKNAVTTHLS